MTMTNTQDPQTAYLKRITFLMEFSKLVEKEVDGQNFGAKLEWNKVQITHPIRTRPDGESLQPTCIKMQLQSLPGQENKHDNFEVVHILRGYSDYFGSPMLEMIIGDVDGPKDNIRVVFVQANAEIVACLLFSL
ncbi:MAG: hypothetical protein Q8P20_09930 [bacterium]|nr:hypothetical protein [bacterium]